MPTKEEVADMLAQYQYENDADSGPIYRLTTDKEDALEEPIKLLKVSDDTVPIGVMPLYFGAHPPSGLHYPFAIVVVTPEEFEKLRAGQLSLPDDWSLGKAFDKHVVSAKVAA